jgi:hypothetical protein
VLVFGFVIAISVFQQTNEFTLRSQQTRHQGEPELRFSWGVAWATEISMALNAHKDPATADQLTEIKRLCHQADIPDKSGELLTSSGAQELIDDLRRKASEHKSQQ